MHICDEQRNRLSLAIQCWLSAASFSSKAYKEERPKDISLELSLGAAPGTCVGVWNFLALTRVKVWALSASSPTWHEQSACSMKLGSTVATYRNAGSP